MWGSQSDPYPIVRKIIESIGRHLRVLCIPRGANKNQAPPPVDVNLNLKLLLWVLVVCRRLGTIGSATALAFARVLALATVVARLATALALT